MAVHDDPAMDGLNWGASAMRAARDRLEIAAHNLANVSTGGFRRRVARVSLTPRGLSVADAAGSDQGGLRRTGRPFDLALAGPGAFHAGSHATRDGAFTRDRSGYLRDAAGAALRGSRGPLVVSEEARVERDGSVRDGGRIVDRLPLPAGTTVEAGALEASGVNAIDETLAILTAQRAFESAQKTVAAIDAAREKAANDVVRLK